MELTVNKWWEKKKKKNNTKLRLAGFHSDALVGFFFWCLARLTDCHAAEASHEALLMLLEAPEPSQLQEGEWKHVCTACTLSQES